MRNTYKWKQTIGFFRYLILSLNVLNDFEIFFCFFFVCIVACPTNHPPLPIPCPSYNFTCPIFYNLTLRKYKKFKYFPYVIFPRIVFIVREKAASVNMLGKKMLTRIITSKSKAKSYLESVYEH